MYDIRNCYGILNEHSNGSNCQKTGLKKNYCIAEFSLNIRSIRRLLDIKLTLVIDLLDIKLTLVNIKDY